MSDTETIKATPVAEDDPFRHLLDEPDTPSVPKSKSKPETELILAGLRKFYFNIGVMVGILDMRDSATIVRNHEDLAESWRTLLDNDAKLRRRMKAMIKSGGWGTVLSAHLVIAIPIATNHGINLSHLMSRKSDNGESE